jgi:hypothetical protein
LKVGRLPRQGGEVLTSMQQLQKAFAGTLLADGVVDDLGPDLFVVDVHPDVPLVEAWRAARDLIPITGRRPFMPGELDLPELTGTEVTDFAAAVGRASSDTALVFGSPDDWPVERADVEAELRGYGLEPLLDEALLHLSFSASISVSRVAFDRWLYERVRRDEALVALLEPRLKDPWRSFHVGQDPVVSTLVLLPAASPSSVAAWMDWFPLHDDPRGRVEFGAVLEEWSARWGAEVVANDGVLVVLDVQRPPAGGEQAWELTHQVQHFAGSLQIDRWLLALLLERSRSWTLFERP